MGVTVQSELTNWIPGDPTLVAQILKISSAYSPPPPEGFISPMTWGVETNVIERFSGAGVPKENVSFARDTFALKFLANRQNSWKHSGGSMDQP